MGERIVSLLPSNTAIVCAIEPHERLVGVSYECDYPTDVGGLPVLTEPKLDPRGTSEEIDRRVREIVQEGLSVYCIKTDVLRGLHPDVIVTQDHCEVCAVALAEVERTIACHLSDDVTVVFLRPSRLDDIWTGIRRVANAVGHERQTETLIERLLERIRWTERTTRGLPRPRVACLEWLSPLMAAGNWLPEIVHIARVVHPASWPRGAYAYDHLGRARRLPSGNDSDRAVRIFDSTIAGGYAGTGRPSDLAIDAGRP